MAQDLADHRGGGNGVDVGQHRVVVGQVEQLGVDHPRVEQVHLEGGVPELDRQRFRPCRERGLGGRVGSLTRGAQPGRHRRHVENLAAAPSEHPGEERGGQADGRHEVDRQHLVDLGVGCLLDPAALGDAGVVDQQVDAAELVVGPPGEVADRIEVGEVDRPGPAVGCVRPASLRHLGQAVGPAGADTHGGPRLGEGHGQCGADARRGAGHQRNPTLERAVPLVHVVPPLLGPRSAAARGRASSREPRSGSMLGGRASP